MARLLASVRMSLPSTYASTMIPTMLSTRRPPGTLGPHHPPPWAGLTSLMISMGRVSELSPYLASSIE